jgi:hypothetical protein
MLLQNHPTSNHDNAQSSPYNQNFQISLSSHLKENLSTTDNDDTSDGDAATEVAYSDDDDVGSRFCYFLATTIRFIIFIILPLSLLSFVIFNKDLHSRLSKIFIEVFSIAAENNNDDGGVVDSLQRIFLLVIFCSAACLVLIPSSLLSLSAGFAFTSNTTPASSDEGVEHDHASHLYNILMSSSQLAGICKAIFVIFTGSLFGGVLAMAVSRHVLLPLIDSSNTSGSKQERSKLLNLLDKAFNKFGVKLLVFLRVFPVLPFGSLGYLCGLAKDFPFQFYIFTHPASLVSEMAYM